VRIFLTPSKVTWSHIYIYIYIYVATYYIYIFIFYFVCNYIEKGTLVIGNLLLSSVEDDR
jgi:hypothetical protein